MASYILIMDSSVHADTAAATSAITSQGGLVSETYSLPFTFKVEADASQVDAMTGVAHSELEGLSLGVRSAGATYSTDPLQRLGRGKNDKNSGDRPLAWSPSYNGTGTITYLMDTGVNSSHNEFSGATVTNLFKLSSHADYSDSDGHGTGVASVIVGQNMGVAPSTNLKVVKMFESSNGSVTVGDVIDALDAILVDHNANTPANPKAVCMPFTLTKNSLVDTKLAELQSQGLILVAAAGNDYGDVDDYSPGGLDSIITVGAVDNNLNALMQTNLPRTTANSSVIPYARGLVLNGELDIWAPGANIDIADASNVSNYSEATGSSLSAGYVAGVVSHYVQGFSSYNAKEIKSIVLTEGHTHAIGDANVFLATEQLDTVIDGERPDWSKISTSLARAPQTTDVELASRPSGTIASVQYGQIATVNIGLSESASNVQVLTFSPLPPFVSFDTSSGNVTIDTSDASVIPAERAPGVYNFAIKGTIDSKIYVAEYNVGVYNTSDSELEGAPEYYYDTDSADYDEVLQYNTSFSVQRLK